MEVCFTFSIFVFLLFTLFRVKHNGINDFCKVSVSLALNAVFFLNHMVQLLFSQVSCTPVSEVWCFGMNLLRHK